MYQLTCIFLNIFIFRIVGLIHDLQAWVKTLKKGARTPKEATTLKGITKFFKEMQVKYGSRWISLPATSINQMYMIKNPVETAKELYGSTFFLQIHQL